MSRPDSTVVAGEHDGGGDTERAPLIAGKLAQDRLTVPAAHLLRHLLRALSPTRSSKEVVANLPPQRRSPRVLLVPAGGRPIRSLFPLVGARVVLDKILEAAAEHGEVNA